MTGIFRYLVLSAIGCLCAGICPGQNLQTLAVPDTTVAELMQSDKARSRADTYYLLALSYARKGNQPEAAAVIERGLKLERNHPKLIGLKAALAAREGRVGDAVAGFRRVLQLDPEDEYARRSLAAIQDAVKATHSRPPGGRDGVALIGAGGEPATIGDDGGSGSPAVAPPKPATGTGSGDGSGPGAGGGSSAGAGSAAGRPQDLNYFTEMRSKQRCYYALSSLKRARDTWTKANPKEKNAPDTEELVRQKLLVTPPKCPAAGAFSWKGSAPVCSRHGEFDAIETEVLTLFKDFNEGLQAKLARNYPDAIKAFNRVISMYPRWAEAHFQLADAMQRHGDDQAAVAQLKQCLKVDPAHLDAQMLLANLYYRLGLRDVALQLLQSVERRVPGSVYAVSAKSIADAIRAGRSYYQVFPPN